MISRLMQGYFIIYFCIAVGQFIVFSFMENIGVTFFIMSSIWIALLMLIADKVPHKKALLFFSLAGIFLKFMWIIAVPTPAVSDYALMYNSAQDMLHGGRDYLNNIYYLRFPYQLGFTTYQAIALWFVDSVSALKLINALWCAIASAAVYGIAREAFNQDVARLAMLLHVTLLPILMLSSVLTNQHIAVAWFYVGIYLWMKCGEKAWFMPVAVGVALAVGTIMRPIGIVIIAAIVVNEIIVLIQQKKQARFKHSIRKIVTTVLSYQLVLFIVGALLTQTGISPDGLKNNDPLWKLVSGLNSEAYGSHSMSDDKLLNYGYMEVALRSEVEKEIIKERLTDPRNMLKLPFLKIGRLWADYQPTWFTFPQKEGTYFNYLGWQNSFDETVDRYRGFERGILYMLSLFAFWGVLKSLRFDFLNDNKRFLVLIMGAYTFAHIVVEVQPRYLYFLFAIIVIFAAAELLNLRLRLKERLGKLELVNRA